MERSEIKGSICVPVLKKLEVRAKKKEQAKKLKQVEVKEMVVVDAVGSKERAKKRKRKRKSKSKRRGLRYKLKPDEVKDMVVMDAGSKEGNSGDKTKLDEVNAIVNLDAGSKKEEEEEEEGEGESTKRLIPQEALDYILNGELADYMLCNPPRKFTRLPSDCFYIHREGVPSSDLLNGMRQLEADVLRENRRANEEAWQVYPRELVLPDL